MQTILNEKFGLYRIEVREENQDYFYHIQCLDEDSSEWGEHYSTAKGYEDAYIAFRAGMIRLAALFWQDLKEIAGNGIRTHDILLGNFPIAVKSSESEVQS